MAEVVFYCQHLTGLGHYVRSREIVRALARRHDVRFVVGGLPVPGDLDAEPYRVVRLPAIVRRGREIVPVDAERSPASVMDERRRRLEETIRDRPPDVFIVEHFPFSKWALADELLPAIDAARGARPGGKVVCSLRDIALTSRFDSAPDGAIQSSDDVVRTLNARFDAVLVHGDPRVTRIEDQLPWASEIRIPVKYTGYVSRPVEPDPGEGSGGRPERGYVVASAGGGAEAFELAGPVIEAWVLGRSRGWTGDRELVIFTGPYVAPDARRRLERMARDASIGLHESTDDLIKWMESADLSISRAGYNTCMNVLETRCRAIVIPSAVMSDQGPRARALSARGCFAMLEAESVTADRLAAAIRDAVSMPAPRHDLALDGASNTLAYVDGLR